MHSPGECTPTDEKRIGNNDHIINIIIESAIVLLTEHTGTQWIYNAGSSWCFDCLRVRVLSQVASRFACAILE